MKSRENKRKYKKEQMVNLFMSAYFFGHIPKYDHNSVYQRQVKERLVQLRDMKEEHATENSVEDRTQKTHTVP